MGKIKVLSIWLDHHSHQPQNLTRQFSLNTEIRFRFMISLIRCQPSLNAIPFTFSPPLLNKPPLSSIPKDKNPLYSPFLSFSEVE